MVVLSVSDTLFPPQPLNNPAAMVSVSAIDINLLLTLLLTSVLLSLLVTFLGSYLFNLYLFLHFLRYNYYNHNCCCNNYNTDYDWSSIVASCFCCLCRSFGCRFCCHIYLWLFITYFKLSASLPQARYPFLHPQKYHWSEHLLHFH